MPKATWGSDVGNSPWEDELEEYAVYEGETPPKGVYRMRLKMLRLKTNKNDEPMLNGLLIINEPPGSKKAQYNGYDTWVNLNVTAQGARWVNNFLSALVPENKVAALRKAFWAQKVMIDKGEPPLILSIGTLKITENMLVSALLTWDSYGEGAMKPKSFSRPTDTTLNEDDLDGPSDEDGEWEDEDGAEEPEPGDDEDEDEDEEYNERAEELEGMDRKALLAAAKAAGVATTRGMKANAIIDLILEEEFPPEDEESEEDEPEDDEEPDEDEEEEPEEEPEPPKRTARRARPAAKEPAKPAARAKTGTRRRRSGQPPF